MMGELRGEDLARMYGAADMFVHTGNTETLGQVLQEAMASGVPVIAPRAGGPINLVRHGETGFLYDPDDPKDLRSKVEQLLADKDLRTRMGQLGLESVRSRTWPAVIDQLVGHYRSAIATYR
jgi:phosphatidylinositol alpha 1,6-mannosyltransferase